MGPEHAHAHRRETDDVSLTIKGTPDALKKLWKALPWVILLGGGGIGGGTGIMSIGDRLTKIEATVNSLSAEQGKQVEKVDAMKEDLKDIKRFLYQGRNR